MKEKLLLLIFMIVIQVTHAQWENIWIMGGSMYDSTLKAHKYEATVIDFNTAGGPSVSTFPNSNRGETSATICDVNGSLLFYTEGDTIWDRNRNAMPNGGGLTGIPATFPGANATQSTTQGALIVPDVSNPDLYYVFSLSDAAISLFNGRTGELYYSVVDMRLNDGLGDVVAGKKGIYLGKGFTESMAGIGGASCNYWVVLAAFASNNESKLFKAYEINESGLSLTPVVSDVGKGAAGRDIGRINFSHDGKKMVKTRTDKLYPLQLFDFDIETGVVSNAILLDTISTTKGYLGACFSPDNSKLYAQNVGNVADKGGLYQFDLADTNMYAIRNSRLLVDSVKIGGVNWHDIKLGPDRKLYYTKLGEPYLKKIDKPDMLGSLCGPQSTTVWIGDDWGDIPFQSFTNNVPRIEPAISTSINEIALCSNQDGLTIEGDTSFFWAKWEDGNANSNRNIKSEGLYWRELRSYCQIKIDTFIVTAVDLSPEITIEEFRLGTSRTYDTYQWLLNDQPISGAIDRHYDVTEDGNYAVIVSGQGCTDTSDAYKVENSSIGNTTIEGADFIVFPNPAQDVIYVKSSFNIQLNLLSLDGRELIKANKSTITISDLSPGIYLLRIANKEGIILSTQRVVKTR